MAADLHIHVAKGVPIEEMEQFVQTEYSESKMVDGKWEDKNFTLDGKELFYDEKKIHRTPSVWIGEVSWLKAGLLGDAGTFVPSTVMRVSEIVGTSLPVIDDEFIRKVREAFDLDNKTTYSLAKVEEVIAFLEGNKGERAFQISW